VTERVSFTVNIVNVAVASTTTTPAEASTSVDAVAQDAAVLSFEESLTPEPVRLGLRLFGYAALLIIGGMLFTEFSIAQGIIAAARAREVLLASGVALTLAPLLQTLIFLDDSRDFGVFQSLFHILEAFDTTAGSMHLCALSCRCCVVGRNYSSRTNNIKSPSSALYVGFSRCLPCIACLHRALAFHEVARIGCACRRRSYCSNSSVARRAHRVCFLCASLIAAQPEHRGVSSVWKSSNICRSRHGW